MQHRRQTGIHRDAGCHPQPCQQRVVSRRPAGDGPPRCDRGGAAFVTDDVDDDEVPAAQRRDACARDLRDVGDLVVAVAVVQRLEDVGAGDTEATCVELDADSLVVVGQIAERPELAQPVTRFADLVEDFLPRRRAGHVGSIDTP
jgi:hypothetical protein